MPYLPEEAAIIDGLICNYLITSRSTESIRDSYWAVHEHLLSERLTEVDYRRILAAIDLLLPTRRNEPREYRLMASARAKTSTALAGIV